MITLYALGTPVYAASPDLTVSSIWLERVSVPGVPVAPTELIPNESFVIVANVTNLGQATASGFYLDVYYDSEYGRGGPDNIASGEVQQWFVGPLTAMPGAHATQWVVDPDNQIAELNEQNNQKQYTFNIGQLTTTSTTTISSTSLSSTGTTSTNTATTATVPTVTQTSTVTSQITSSTTTSYASTTNTVPSSTQSTTSSTSSLTTTATTPSTTTHTTIATVTTSTGTSTVGSTTQTTIVSTTASTATATSTVPTTSTALTIVILSPGNQTIVTSSPVRLLAQVTTGGTAVQGATVTVIVDGNAACSGNSNSTGYFLCTYSLSQSGHVYTWYANASRLGVDSAKSSSTSFTFAPSGGTCAITYKLSDLIVGSSGRTASLLLSAQCSKSVGSYQFVIDLPLGSQISSVGSPTVTGFMAGGSLLTSGAQLRWFSLGANGGATGNLTIPIRIATGLPSASNLQITLNSTTTIRDVAGTAMLVSPALPLSSSVNVIYPVATTTVYGALDAYFSNSVWSPIGRVPRVGDLYDLLDIYFTG